MSKTKRASIKILMRNEGSQITLNGTCQIDPCATAKTIAHSVTWAKDNISFTAQLSF